MSAAGATADPRLYPARPILAASIAVFREGRVLLAERVNPPAADCFSLPGGLVEPGETLQAAALRELMEETGVSAHILGFNEHVEVIEPDAAGRIVRHFVVCSFVGEWIAGEGVTGPEARRILWADPRDVDGLATTPDLLRVLRAALRFFPRRDDASGADRPGVAHALLLGAAPAPLPPAKPAGMEAPAAPPAATLDALPPYEPDVERLAGLMGTLSFMRDLCGAGDGAQWRSRMEELLAAEGATPARRDRLAGAFNEGLRGYATTYRKCTPAASAVIERALDEAARLSQDLTRRYGG